MHHFANRTELLMTVLSVLGMSYPMMTSVSPEIEIYCLAVYILFLLNFIREQWFITIPPLRMSKKFLHLSPLATALRRDTILW